MKKVLVALAFVTTTVLGAAGSQWIGGNLTAAPVQAATAATPAPAEEAAAAAVTTTATTSATAAMTSALTLPEVVRQATAQFQDLKAAEAAGYGLVHGCVAGPTGGAMGVHFANGDIVGDGEIDAQHPEAIIYEQAYGQMHMVGVEYIVIAEQWDAKHKTPPVLMGQLFNYNSAPNRYGLPAFYELHVWAWKHNPSGMFADWNPNVSCEEFTGDMSGMDMGQ
jgi:hypothetical protein